MFNVDNNCLLTSMLSPAGESEYVDVTLKIVNLRSTNLSQTEPLSIFETRRPRFAERLVGPTISVYDS